MTMSTSEADKLIKHFNGGELPPKNNLMKLSSLNFSFLVTLSILPFFSCTNQYERQAMGYYEVDSYERKDSLSKGEIDLPVSLTLHSNKTFSLVFKDTSIKGKWTANDYGDWTLVEFLTNNNKIQTQLGIGEISVINPLEFNCAQLKKIVFKKVNK